MEYAPTDPKRQAPSRPAWLPRQPQKPIPGWVARQLPPPPTWPRPIRQLTFVQPAQAELSETESAPPVHQIEAGEFEPDYDPATYVAHDDPDFRQSLTKTARFPSSRRGGGDA